MSPSVLSVLSLIATLAYLQIGLFVLFKNMAVENNRWFFLFTITLALWASGLIIFETSSIPFAGYTLFRLSVVGGILFPVVLVKYLAIEAGSSQNATYHKWLLKFIALIAMCLLGFAMFNMELFGQRLLNTPMQFAPSFFWFGVSYLGYLVIALSAIVLIFIEWRHRVKGKLEYGHYLFFRNLLGLTILAGVVVDLLLPFWGVIVNLNIAHLFGLIPVGFISFGLFQQKWFSLTPELAADRIVGHSQKIVFFCNPDGWIFKTNPYTLNLLAVSEKELLGRSLASVFTDPLLILQTLHHSKGIGIPEEIDAKILNPNGDPIPVKILFLLVKDSFSDILGIIVYGNDQRETIALEQEVAQKKELELKMAKLGEELENRVMEKNTELSKAYKILQAQLLERIQVEEKIKADAEEKELLIMEIHDRVKENMGIIISLIRGQSAKSPILSKCSKLAELEQKIKTILLIHDNMYFSTIYSQVDFGRFVYNLVALHKQNGSIDIDTNYTIELQEPFLSYHVALPVGLIINELLTNALVHGRQNGRKMGRSIPKLNILIGLTVKNGIYTLVVKDNGSGLPKNFSMKTLATNGLPLVEILAKDQIGGTFEITSDEGVHAVVKFSQNAVS
ncbi:MAG TPA: hypothetical protein DCM62_02840 [Bacteroidales bacterium]|nr:hypothetical protein [Bacteroidales bacterium]